MRNNTQIVMKMAATLLMSVSLVVTIAASGSNGPRMVIDKSKIKISQKEVNQSKLELMRFDFTLTNKGDANLAIIRVDPSCTCTNSELKSKSLEPTKSTVLSLFIERNTLFVGKKVYAIIADNSKEKYHKVEVEITE